MGLKAAFSTSNDIITSGTCKSFWTFKNGKWKKSNTPCFSTSIFDKFLPRTKKLLAQRKLIFSSTKVKPFNNQRLRVLFSDKHQTYMALKQFMAPTVKVTRLGSSHIEYFLQKLQNLIDKYSSKDDFSNALILKDRFGAGGLDVYRINPKNTIGIKSILTKNSHTSFIIQPFIKFNKGYVYHNTQNYTEIRLIYLRQKIVQTYIRISGNKNFLCNEGKGGIEIKRKDVPQDVLGMALKILKVLKPGNALFALDFIVSNKGNVYLLEGNISPGINWYNKYPKNVRMNKQMINIIVAEILHRSRHVLTVKVVNKNLDALTHQSQDPQNLFQLLTPLPKEVV